MSYILAILLGYLVGSLPTTRLSALYLRRRSTPMGRGAILLTLLGDVFKGVAAVELARWFWGAEPTVVVLAGLASVVGHQWSLFWGGRGGGGTLTAAGALGALSPLLLLLTLPIPLLFMAITRLVTLDSLLGSSVALLLAGVFVWQHLLPPSFLLFPGGFFLLNWYLHRPNLVRLRDGTERRLGERRALSSTGAYDA